MYSMATENSFPEIRSVVHIFARSFIQNGNPIFPVSSSVNCVEDLAPEYSNSRPYVPTSHAGEPDSIGNGDGEFSIFLRNWTL